jgi:predicted  nucleic acid-binding Zn-ribbon protein
MLQELDQLAERISLLAALARNLREENQVLRVQLTDAEANGRSLRSRLDAARQRIEALIEKLPAE